MSWSAIASMILGLLKLAPALYAALGDQLQREREAAAEKRRQEKDARVEDALTKVTERGAPFDESLTAAREIPKAKDPNPKKVSTEEIT